MSRLYPRIDLHAYAQPTLLDIAASVALAGERFAAAEAEHVANRARVNAMLDKARDAALARRDEIEEKGRG